MVSRKLSAKDFKNLVDKIHSESIDKISIIMGINKDYIENYKKNLIKNTDYKCIKDTVITNKNIEKPKNYKIREKIKKEPQDKIKNKYSIFTSEFFDYHIRNKDNWTSDVINVFCEKHNINMKDEYIKLNMNIRSDKMKLSAMLWSIHPNNPKIKNKSKTK